MSKIPSVKGSVFIAAVESVKKLLAENQVSRAETSRWLQPGDLELIESGKLSISAWYDIRIFDRLNYLLRDVAGGGDDDYMRELGRESARRLGKAGVYGQLEYLNRTQMAGHEDPRARFEAFGRDLRLLQTIAGSIYNFAKWSLEIDPAHPLRYWVVWTDATPFSDLTCLRAEGFSNEMATSHGRPNLWRYVRPGRDVVHYRMQEEV
jgi:hypothetical protein